MKLFSSRFVRVIQFIFLSCICIFLFSFIGCSVIQPSENDSEEPSLAPLQSFSQSILPDNEIETPPPIQCEPSLFVAFDSIEEMRAFIRAANGKEEDYAASTTEPIVSYQEARYIAFYLQSHSLPVPKAGQNVEYFHAAFYADRNEFTVNYVIDGIRYRFLCGYNAPEMIHYNSVAGTISWCGYEFDMYWEYDEFYSGSVSHGTSTLTAMIYKDADVSELTLERFELLPILLEAE